MTATPASEPKARKPGVTEGRRELHDLIRTARAMEDRRLNPFLLDIAEALELADRFFPVWRDIEDLTLDARALNSISRVVKMQEGRLRYQAQLFHADPEAMAEKLTAFKTETLGRMFLASWHPIVEREQLTTEFLEEAMRYWEQLQPMEVRHRQRPRKEPPRPEDVSLDDLLARGVLARDGFGDVLVDLWEQLKARGNVDYWEFIDAKSYGQKVRRAYATSYLITYGWAWLSEEEGKLVLHPRGAQEPPQKSVSLPIVLRG